MRRGLGTGEGSFECFPPIISNHHCFDGKGCSCDVTGDSNDSDRRVSRPATPGMPCPHPQLEMNHHGNCDSLRAWHACTIGLVCALTRPWPCVCWSAISWPAAERDESFSSQDERGENEAKTDATATLSPNLVFSFRWSHRCRERGSVTCRKRNRES